MKEWLQKKKQDDISSGRKRREEIERVIRKIENREELSESELVIRDELEERAVEFVKILALARGYDVNDDIELEEFVAKYSEIRANEN